MVMRDGGGGDAMVSLASCSNGWLRGDRGVVDGAVVREAIVESWRCEGNA
jgi:hypothetical protein